MTADNPVPQVDVDALAAEAAMFLGQVPAGEGIGVKLSNMLVGFLETESYRKHVGQPIRALIQRHCSPRSRTSCASTPRPSGVPRVPMTSAGGSGHLALAEPWVLPAEPDRTPGCP